MATLKNRTNHKNSNHYDLSGDVEKIKAALFDTTQDLRGRAGEILLNTMDNMKERSNMVKDNIADYTAEKPLKSLGIAFAAGIAIGWLLRRK